MKQRGVVIAIVGVLVAAAVFVWWKRRDTSATETAPEAVTQGSASGSAARGSSGSSAATKGSARVSVTVTGDRGPIADAAVRLAPEDGEVVVVRTGADGVAHAEQLAVGTWTIAASATGFAPSSVEAELVADQHATLSLVLAPSGATLSGTVTDVSGGPIAGARVDAAVLGDGKRLGRASSAVATVFTATDGTYKLSVATGPHVVSVASPDYAPQSKHVEITAAGASVNFALVPGGVIEGIVRDERTREPVAGATISARRDGGGALMMAEAGRYRGVSGSDGRFRLAGLRPGAFALTAAIDKRVTRDATVVGIGVAEQVTDVELLVGVGLVVSGTVVDENDRPVPRVSVSTQGEGAGLVDTSDEAGAFSFVGLPPGTYFLLPVADDWAAKGITAFSLATSDITGLKVRVQRAAKISGHVEPRQPCTISHEADPRSFTSEPPMLVAPVQTDANGDFTLAASPAKATLVARCPSGAHGTAEYDPAATAPLVVKVTQGASIAGRVVDGKGSPVAGASVMAAADGNERRVVVVNGMVTSGVQALTNAKGEYVVNGLEPGPYALSVLERGRPLRMRDKIVRVTVAEREAKTGVDISVDRADGVIRGVVTGPDGAPLADAWVSANQSFRTMLEDMEAREREGRDGANESRSTMTISSSDSEEPPNVSPVLTDASGRFEISGLAHARYEVIAEAKAGALRGRAVNITPDATVNLQALGLTKLTGTVRGATGPAKVFRVELDGPTSEARTFTDGTFSFDRVDPGAYKLRVTSTEGNAEVTATVVANQPTTVNVTLAANAVVVGRLVDADGAPLANQGVVIVPDAGDGRTSVSLEGPPPTSGSDGSFRLEAKAGTAILVVLISPRPFTQRGLKLEAGQTLDLGSVRVVPN